ncbi:MAG TPA: phosphatase [Firmicutes bacterium]|nr:phosphatase [Bacillota bacterium]
MNLVADLHTHTVASGHAYSTINENARAAAARGLEMIGFTDHGPAIRGGPDPYHFGSLRVLPRYLHGVRILRGIEANIMAADGTLDLSEEYLRRLDIVLAGFHPGCYDGGNVVANTDALIAAMENPYVDIIVHPGNPQYPVDIPVVVREAVRLGICLEINNASFSLSRKGSKDNCQHFARICADQGAILAINSDAHFMGYVGEFREAVAVVKEAGVVPEQVLNTSTERVLDYLRTRGKQVQEVTPQPPI